MFSFFRGKKHSPRSSPEPDEQPPIPGPDSDYVIVSDKSKSDSKDGTPSSQTPSGYPSFNQFGIPNDGNMMNNNNRPRQDIPVHYLHGVPFKLSNDLMIGDTTEMSRIQVDEILVNITRKLQLENEDYNFKQERSIVLST